MNPFVDAIVERARTVRPPGRVVELVQRLRSDWLQGRPTAAGMCYSQLHIDVARYATGDFNPFHDAAKWRQIQRNPFRGPIALGFQLEMLLREAVYRQQQQEENGRARSIEALPFAHYSFRFADVVLADEPVTPEVRPTRTSRDRQTFSNRVILRKQGRAVLMGQVQQRATPGEGFTRPTGPGGAAVPVFMCRRRLQVSDAKNFLVGARVEPQRYFDDLEGLARFPDLFPVALISSALLEQAVGRGHDFLRDPMVYTAHTFDLHRALLGELEDGERLTLVVEGPDVGSAGPTKEWRYHCRGILEGERLLFRAEVRLVALEALGRLERLRGGRDRVKRSPGSTI